MKADDKDDKVSEIIPPYTSSGGAMSPQPTRAASVLSKGDVVVHEVEELKYICGVLLARLEGISVAIREHPDVLEAKHRLAAL